jgi:hypothetical protein
MDDSQSPPLPNSGYRGTSAEPIEPGRDKRADLTTFGNLHDQRYGEQIVPSTSMISPQWDETALAGSLGNCQFVHE